MYYSPKTSTDGLVFHYDTGNTVRSYLGEPTTNQFTNPDFSNGTTGWTFGSWDGGRYTYTTETVMGPFGRPVTALKVVRTTSDTSYAHFHQGNGGKFTNGNTYTLSAYVKGSGTLNQNTQGGYSPITYNPGQSVTLTGEWQRISYTLPSQTDSLYPYWAAEGITQNVPMYFTLAQSEQKSHITPFVNGTRSATQGLLDLTGNRTTELANVSFNSSAQPEFDGSNDLITFGGSANIVNKSYTIEAVFNRYSANRLDGIIGDLQYHWFSFYVTSNNELYFFHRRNSPYTDNGAISATGLVGTGYYHAVGVFDTNSGMRVYLNGNLVASNSNTTAFDLSGRGPQYIGQHRGGAPSSPAVMSGQIPMLKIYEGKALTADEVQRNFNAVKSRFNIA